MEKLWDKLQELLFTYGESLFWALLLIVVGTIAIKKILLPMIEKVLMRGKTEALLSRFLMSFVSIALYVVLIIIVMSQLNIDTTSIIAVLGSCGVAIGLALQNTLANVAGGIFVLFTKPFVIGDYIDVTGTEGTVTDISILHTKLNTIDNKATYIPNNQMATNKLTNHSREQSRRLDLTLMLSYGVDFRVAKEILAKLCADHPKVLDTPAPVIRVGELAMNSVNVVCQCWVKNEDYWDVKYDMLEQIKLAFDEAGMNVPFVRPDVKK